MTAFDFPVVAVDGKNALRVGLIRRPAGDSIGDITGIFAAFFVCGFTLDDKSLTNVREIQIVVEFGCGPYFADFDSAMVRRVTKDKIGVLPVFKIKRNVFKKSGLVVFDSEKIMRFTVYDVLGNVTLVQQSVGGNIFTFNINGVQQRNDGFDFVRAFEFSISPRQSAYFFWVWQAPVW